MIRVLMLTYVDATGGIATWARILREAASPKLSIEVIDTSQRYIVSGSRSPIRRVLFGGRDAIIIWVRSRRVVVERNLIVNCDRGVAFGNPGADRDRSDHDHQRPLIRQHHRHLEAP